MATVTPTNIRTIEPYPTISLFEYEQPVIKAVLTAIKFHSNIRIAKEFPKAVLTHPALPSQADTVWIPIPIHTKRLRQRGFNQVDYLFKPWAEKMGIPYIPALKRIKETQPLFGLNPAERQAMIADAFELDPNYVTALQGKNGVIVDDIFTTGSTLQEASKTLHKASVKSTIGLTVAKALQ